MPEINDSRHRESTLRATWVSAIAAAGATLVTVVGLIIHDDNGAGDTSSNQRAAEPRQTQPVADLPHVSISTASDSPAGEIVETAKSNTADRILFTNEIEIGYSKFTKIDGGELLLRLNVPILRAMTSTSDCYLSFDRVMIRGKSEIWYRITFIEGDAYDTDATVRVEKMIPAEPPQDECGG